MEGLAGTRVAIARDTSRTGAATAQRFREEGCDIVILARGTGPDVLQCDVSDRTQTTAAFARIGHATKAGIVRLSQSLALESAPETRVM